MVLLKRSPCLMNQHTKLTQFLLTYSRLIATKQWQAYKISGIRSYSTKMTSESNQENIRDVCRKNASKKIRGYDQESDEEIKEVRAVGKDIKKTIRSFLMRHNLPIEIGNTGFITSCQSKKINSEQKTLYINYVTGNFICETCQYHGGWEILRKKLLVDSKMNHVDTSTCFKDQQFKNVGAWTRTETDFQEDFQIPIYKMNDTEFTAMTHLFNCKGLHQETFSKYGVSYSTEQNGLPRLHLKYVTQSQELVGIQTLSIVQIPNSSEEDDYPELDVSKSYVPRTGYPQLYGWQDYSKTNEKKYETVVITASEMDAMAVTQETSIVGMALPKENELPLEVLYSLEKVKKIIIWLGSKDSIRATSKMFAKKLGEDRCSIIWYEAVKANGPLEAVQLGRNLKEVLSMSTPISVQNVVGFGHLRNEVYSEFANVDQVAGVKWKRFTTLNNVLRGFRAGELTVFTGNTGSGKTTFISEYSLDLCMQGVNTLWGSFEINNVRLSKMMLSQFAVKSFQKSLQDFDYWANKFEELPLHFMTFHGQESIQRVKQTLIHAVYSYDVQHVILDNLQFMMGSNMADHVNKFAIQDYIIGELRKFATEFNCHVTLVIHPRKENDELTTNSIFGSAKATQEADNVIILQGKQISPAVIKKYIQVVKNRFDGTLGVAMLKFDKESKTLSGVGVATKKKKLEETKQDNELRETDAKKPKQNLKIVFSSDKDLENEDIDDASEFLQ